MVQVVFFVGLRRSRARVGTGGVESDDRGITRELVSPSLGETESWIGVVQFIQSQPQDAGLSDSDIYCCYNTHDFTHTTDIREVRRLRADHRSAGALGSEAEGAQGRSVERTKTRLWVPRISFPLGTEAKVARQWTIRRRANATEHLNGGVRRRHFLPGSLTPRW